MKKIKQLVLLFLVSTLTLVSCNKDEDSSIEGNWLFTSEGTLVGGQEILVPYEHTAGCNQDFIQFITGGVANSFSFENNGSGCNEYLDSAVWSKNGDNLIINDSGDITVMEILELSDSKLKLRYFDNEEQTYYLTVATRF